MYCCCSKSRRKFVIGRDHGDRGNRRLLIRLGGALCGVYGQSAWSGVKVRAPEAGTLIAFLLCNIDINNGLNSSFPEQSTIGNRQADNYIMLIVAFRRVARIFLTERDMHSVL